MNISDRTRKLRERIVQNKTLRTAHDEAEGFRNRIQELQEMRQALSSALEKLALLSEKSGTACRAPSCATALQALVDYELQVNSTDQDGGKEYGKLKRALGKIANDATNSIDKALTAIKKRVPSIDEPFLRQVEKIPGFETKANEIRQQRDAILRESELEGLSAQDLRAFLERLDALNTLTDGLRVTEFPKEVLDFFASARRQGGATFDKLTDGVRQWLEERDELKHLRITIVSR